MTRRPHWLETALDYLIPLAVFLCVLFLYGCASVEEYDRHRLRFSDQDTTFAVRPSQFVLTVTPHYSKAELRAICNADWEIDACADLRFLAQQQCVIHTLPNISMLMLGHETRHCFDGWFHD